MTAIMNSQMSVIVLIAGFSICASGFTNAPQVASNELDGDQSYSLVSFAVVDGGRSSDAGILNANEARSSSEFMMHRKPRRHRKTSKSGHRNANKDMQRDTVIIGRGYSPSTINVEGGRPLQLTFVSTGNTCANSLSIPGLKKSLSLQAGQSETITFTPKKNQTIAYSCTMDMYHGTIVAK
jgi:hypothetical protein